MFTYIEKKYTYIIYDFIGENCSIEGNIFNYYLDVGDLPFNIYINETLLRNYSNGIYTITNSDLKIGTNYIITKENENSEIINLTEINNHPSLQIEIYDQTITQSSGIKLLVSTLNSFFINDYNNIIDIYSQNLTDGTNKRIIIENCKNLERNSLSTFYNCTGNINENEIGSSKIISFNKCRKEEEIGKIVIFNDNSQKLISISPDFIDIKEKNDISIKLTFSQIFNIAPTKIALVNKITEKIANGKYIDNIKTNNNIIYFSLDYNFISEIIPGKYYIKLLNDNEEEYSSSETLFIGNKLSLYDNRQRLCISNQSITKIGVNFKNDISSSQILEVNYNEKPLAFKIHEDYNNILIINTTNQVPLSQTGNYIFTIIENSRNVITYTLETIIKTGSESDILFSHIINTKTENGNAYIVISANDDIFSMNYTLDDIEDPNYKVLSQLWTNTFVLETKVDEGNFIFSYYKGSNYSKIYTINQIIYIVKDTTFLMKI